METRKKKTATKKEIRSKIEESVNVTLGTLHLKKPSKKISKLIVKASKEIAGKVAVVLKKAAKKATKKTAAKELNGQRVKAEMAA